MMKHFIKLLKLIIVIIFFLPFPFFIFVWTIESFTKERVVPEADGIIEHIIKFIVMLLPCFVIGILSHICYILDEREKLRERFLECL